MAQMTVKNKDLNIILESFLRAIRQHGGQGIPAIAFVLTPEGKLAQFSGQSSHANASRAEAIRYLEKGIATLVRERKCKAIALTFEAGSTGLTRPSIFLEHQDNSAYLIQLPNENGGPVRCSLNDLAPVPAEPRFFSKFSLR